MNLHKNQERLLALLANNIDSPLSIRELKYELGLSSPSLVHHHISQLEKKGYLKRNPNNPSDYQVLLTPENPIAFINIYGLAQCGPNGTLLDGNPIERVALASNLISFPVQEAFLVKAKGNSMEPEIKDGDLIIARKTSYAENNQIVICAFNEMALIKRIRKTAKDQIILESVNPEYAPIIVDEENTLRIEGVFQGLIRR